MLSIENLEKTFPARRGGAPARALGGVSLDVAEGEFFALLGPSGCGKTTILQSIAGLEAPDGGRIRIAGRTVCEPAAGIFVPASDRMLGMVFQSYAIWPHMSVFDNVAFPLTCGRERPPRAEIARRVGEALERVKLASLADRLAPHLSGGQQQRVAIARAIVHEPRLLLLDEPLSNLDARLRDTMREELLQIVKSLGITTIFVTHDQVEAMGMADRIAVIDKGAIVQTGAPREIYFAPRTAFVANFVGRGNMIAGKVTSLGRAGGETVARVATDIGEIGGVVTSDVAVGEAALCIIRPQAFLAPCGGTDENRFEGTLTAQSFLGDFIHATMTTRGVDLRVVFNSYERRVTGEALNLAAPFGRCVVVPAQRA